VLLGFLETRSARPISLAAANLNRGTIVWFIKTRGPAYFALPHSLDFNHDDASDETRSARPIALAAINLTRGTIVWSITLAAQHILLCPIPWIFNRADASDHLADGDCA
jgi:hypothetical protein